MSALGGCVLLLAAWLPQAGAAPSSHDAEALDAQSTAEAVDFQSEVRPILSDRCFTCHGPDAAAREADLRLDVRAGALADLGGYAAIVPGDVDASELVYRITTEHDADRMPPADSGLELDAREIDVLRRWIEQGAPYTPHWAFVPPERHAPPADPEGWARDPLDRFVRARMADAGLQPKPPADDATWLRRAAFALTGLPPEPALTRALLEGATTRGEAVDQLLASPHFGERLAAQWLDVARYADTYGYQNDRERRVWPYRDWVIQAGNDNLPYDDFLRWQIAGDLLDEPTREQRIATAFQRLHRQTNEGGSVEEEFRVEYVSDRVHTTGTAFLGLTFECARCHDHKYDPVSQREYFQLADYFDDVDESGLYSHFTNATPTPAMDLPSEEQRAEFEAAAQRVRALEAALRSAAAAQPLPAPARLAPNDAPRGRVHFPLDDWTDGRSPGVGGDGAEARAEGAFERVPGLRDTGVRLNGDEGLRFSGVGAWNRSDPFAVGLALRLDEPVDRAVLLHRSRAWHDAASQGWQLLIEDGRLSFALVHFWPGDMIAVRTVAPLPIGEWAEIAASSDGSSRAAGLRLWVDGQPAAVEVVRDSLTRSITGGGPGDPAFGARFRDRGFSQGVVDEVWFADGELAAPARTQAAGSGDGAVDGRVDPADIDAETGDPRERLRAARRERDALRDAIPQLMVMEEGVVQRDARLLDRGAYNAPGEAVGRGVPAVLLGDRPQPRDRRELADWLTAPEHPLTARVEVDRLWRLVFGRGLVRTPENWGSQGESPTHPELLDTLARDFVDSGWDRKALLRRFVLSSTFGQRSGPRSEDPENRLWSSGPARRLSAEMLRDAALAHADLLVRRIGGPSVKPYQPPGLWEEKSGQRYQPDTGDGLYRRSLYTFWKRTSPPPAMMIFDAAKRDVCVVARQRTNTPLQALALWNDPQRIEAARVLAAALLRRVDAAGEKQAGAAEGAAQDDAAAVAALFQELLLNVGGLADADVTPLLALWESERAAFARDPDAAAALLAVGEAPAADDLDPARHAAMTVVCAALLSSELAVVLR